jgi:hypothetical protein
LPTRERGEATMVTELRKGIVHRPPEALTA